MKKYLLAVFVLAMTALVGCEHTVQGFGQDMQQTGKSIQNSVNN